MSQTKNTSAAVTSLVNSHAAQSCDPQWLGDKRSQALQHFEELGLPTTKLEAWKYTNLRALKKHNFVPSEAGAGAWTAEELVPWSMVDLDAAARLVFLDGRYQAALSSIGDLPEGVQVGSLAQAIADEHPLVREHLTQVIVSQDEAFVALNEAFFEDGLFLSVPRGKAVEKPILVLHVTSTQHGARISNPRNLVVIGAAAQAELVEVHFGQSRQEGDIHLTNTVTEEVIGADAILRRTRIQQEPVQDVHMTSGRTLQSRGSVYEGRTYWLGASMIRNQHEYTLQGEGIECRSDSTYVVRGKRHVDNLTIVDHAKPHGESFQLCKGLLMEQGRGVFQGKVIVRQDAQKTNANQSNPNLVLSPLAVADTRPQLEIYADDVLCTHGATVGGELDPNSLFYLRSRGLPLSEARQILARAFVYELVEAERHESVRDHLDGALDTLFAGWDPS